MWLIFLLEVSQMRTKPASHERIRALTEGAILVALAFVLSFVKLYELPNGGSLTPAMFPVLLFALRWGVGRGLMAGFVFGLLQLLFDGAYAWGWQSMLLDYLLAFTPLGLAGLFRGKAWGIFPGTLVGCLGRYLIHHISGVTIYRIIEPTAIPGLGTYDNPHLYSLVYNGSYMIPNMVLALLIAGALYVPMKRFFAGNDLRK
jgi:thiamine transporter